MKQNLLYLLLIFILSSCSYLKPVKPIVTIHDHLAGGANLDVVTGSNKKIYLVSDQLYIFDKDLNQLAVN
jgi:hypothetical protein